MSAFSLRGIVEGFYGPQWSWRDRADAVGFCGECGFNAYIYAPKGDPYHREMWKEAYPASIRKKFRGLLDQSRKSGVRLFWALSPGLSIGYGSASDFRLLSHKFDAMIAEGFSRFALFLDDIPDRLQRPADLKKYGTLAAAQADLVNRLHDRLREKLRETELLFCPTQYHGVGESDYWKTLGTETDPAVEIFWTGPQICSPEIRADQAKAVGEQLKRPPLIWDNYPVNDYFRGRLNLGPLRGRDPELARRSSGLFANPMNEPALSRIPLRTVADYLNRPDAYDPEASWRRAIRREGGEDAALLKELAEAFKSGFFADEPSPPLEKKIRAASDRIRMGKQPGPSLKKSLLELAVLPSRAKRSELPPAFLKEFGPYLKKMESLGKLSAMLLDARPFGSVRERETGKSARVRSMRKKLNRLREAPHVVYGGLVEFFLHEALKSGDRREPAESFRE